MSDLLLREVRLHAPRPTSLLGVVNGVCHARTPLLSFPRKRESRLVCPVNNHYLTPKGRT